MTFCNQLSIWKQIVYPVLVLYHLSLGSSFTISNTVTTKSKISRMTVSLAEEDSPKSQTTAVDVGEEPLSKKALGVLFDIDGTIADSWKLGFDATQEVLKRNNIELITEHIYHEHTRYCTPDRLARHAGLSPDQQSEFESVGERLGKEFDELYVGLVSQETAGFYDGVSELLLGLPDSVKVGALTNACVDYAYAVLKKNDEYNKNNIYEKFVTIHGADSVPKPKPSPDGLMVCCSEIGLTPNQCVYVGDSPSDAEAAKAAGMLAIGVLWGSHSEEKVRNAPFDYICQTVDELRMHLPQA